MESPIGLRVCKLTAVVALLLASFLVPVAHAYTLTTVNQLPPNAPAKNAAPLWLVGPQWFGGCDNLPGTAPVMVGLVWDESPGWIPVWELQLVVSDPLVPTNIRPPAAAGPHPHTKRLAVGVARPEWGHTYEATLSFNPQTGAVSLYVFNATTQERVHVAEMRLLPAPAEPQLQPGFTCTYPRIDTGRAVTFIEGHFTPAYVPRGLAWNIVEQQADGKSYVPLGRIERNAAHQPGVQVKLLEASPASEVRLRLLANDATQVSERIYPIAGGDNFLAFDTAALRPGSTEVVLEYLVDGTAQFTDRKRVQVGAAKISLDRSSVQGDVDRLGTVTIETDGPVAGFQLSAQAVATRLVWDGKVGRYQHQSYGEHSLLGGQLDLATSRAQLQLPLPHVVAAEPGLWQLEISITGGTESIPVAPVKSEIVMANFPKPVVQPGDAFTIAILPDTQYYSFESTQGGYPDMFLRQTHWLAETAADQNIALMLHVGDITEHNRADEWLVGKKSIEVLDGIVPYALAVGNHDIGPPGTRGTGFNTYFPLSNYDGLPSFGGLYRPGQLENSYHKFQVAEMSFLVLVLEFWPRDEVVAWADEVLTAHPDHTAIVLTHTYTGSNGRRRATGYDYSVGQSTGGAGLNTGADMWEKLIRKHPNVLIVMSGHVPHSAVPRDIGIGDHGNAVYEMLMDFQFDPNGGNGWLGLLHFPAERDRIEVSVYSPVLDDVKHDAKGGFYVPFVIDLTNRMYRQP